MVGAAMELWARLGIGERAEESGSERRKRMLCSRAPSQELPITSDALAERCFGNFPYAACHGTRVRKSSLSFDEALSHFPH